MFVLASCASQNNSLNKADESSSSKTARSNTAKVGQTLSKGLKLVSSSKSPMRASLPDQGSGISYRFEVELETNEQIDFTKAWIRGKCYPVVMKRMMPEQVGTPTKRGEKLVLYVYHYDKLPMNKSVTMYDDKPPFSYSGEGLISYEVEGEVSYLQVKKIPYAKS